MQTQCIKKKETIIRQLDQVRFPLFHLLKESKLSDKEKLKIYALLNDLEAEVEKIT